MKKLIYLFVINFFLITKSFALIEIDITRGNLDPLPIAISPLHVDIKSENYDGIKIKVLGEVSISRTGALAMNKGAETVKDNKGKVL